VLFLAVMLTVRLLTVAELLRLVTVAFVVLARTPLLVALLELVTLMGVTLVTGKLLLLTLLPLTVEFALTLLFTPPFIPMLLFPALALAFVLSEAFADAFAG